MPKINTVRGIENRKVVSQSEWLVARKKLLLEEKNFSKLRDELKPSTSQTAMGQSRKGICVRRADGQMTLADLFCGKSQLIIYHFMFGPDWQQGCEHCSFWPTTSTA